MFPRSYVPFVLLTISYDQTVRAQSWPQLGQIEEAAAKASSGATSSSPASPLKDFAGYRLVPGIGNEMPVGPSESNLGRQPATRPERHATVSPGAGRNEQAQALSIQTIAGPALPVDGAQAITQAIDDPVSVAVDASGNLYVAILQSRVYRISLSGTLTLVAGSSYGFSGDGGFSTSAQLASPGGIALDNSGNLYIADTDNHRIRKVTAGGTISTVAGNGTAGYNLDGVRATLAQLSSPSGVAVDGAGNLYIADAGNHRIRKVGTDGEISTVAGNGSAGFSGDFGPAVSAQLSLPSGVALDGLGNLYIADTGNHRIRKVTAKGVISTVAGDGSAGFGGDFGPAITAQLSSPSGIAADAAGTLYIADAGNHRIRKVTPKGVGGTISTLAGKGTSGFSGDDRPATSAELYYPSGVAVDAFGIIFIADTRNQRVRRVTGGGLISTVAGNGTSGFSGDGGQATSAQLSSAMGVAVDAADNLFIADTNNHCIRKVTPGGLIIAVAGNGTSGFSGDGGQATSAQLSSPFAVTVDGAGNIFIADTFNQRIRKVSTDGVIRTVAGNGAAGFGGDLGPARLAQLSSPSGIAVDASGYLYIADSGNNRIRQVTDGGVISTVAGGGSSLGDGGLAMFAQLSSPSGIGVDAAGNLYIADRTNHRIRKVTAEGMITTVAGDGTDGFSGDDGPASSAQLSFPRAVAADAAGNIFISDTYNQRIRKITPEGVISTVVGNGKAAFSGDGGLATSAQLSSPSGVAVNAAGNYYIADAGNSRIRKVFASGQPGAATLLAPSGSIKTSTPTYTWKAVPFALYYFLWVNDAVTSQKVQQWFTADQARCASGAGICSVAPSVNLAAGAAQWWIQTWNNAGYGPWSSAMSFTVAVDHPGKASLISPSGILSTNNPTYSWNAVRGSTWYYLWVSDSGSSPKIQQWYTSAQAGCASGIGTCSLTPGTVLLPGAAQWWILTFNDAGYGSWSDVMEFTAAGGAPEAATLVSPSGAVLTRSPIYVWKAVATAAWYHLWVADSGSSSKIQLWYSAGQAGCASGIGNCSVTPGIALTPGIARWWIQTWNISGYGPWSTPASFTVP